MPHSLNITQEGFEQMFASQVLAPFKKLLNKRPRSAEEGADTILWLATAHDYPNGEFWFDRKQAITTILNLNKSSEEEDELLWKYCESILASIKGLSS